MGEALLVKLRQATRPATQGKIKWWTNDIKMVKYQKGHGLLLKNRNERICSSD